MSEPPIATGAIHDLGYKRYLGSRRPPSTRWRVIARHQIANSWKTWWRFKAAVGIAVIVTFVAGGFMYFASNSEWIRQIIARAPFPIEPADIPLPYAIAWYCRAAFWVSLTIGAGVIATDVQSGAFTFYFARSIRPIDYVAGKLVGVGNLVAILVLGGPLLLAGLRLGLSQNLHDLVHNLVILPKVALIGGVATLAYTAVPLGFSALVGNPRYALALWAAYYLIIGTIAQGLGFVSSGSIGALDLPTAIQAVTFDLFDVTLIPRRHAATIPLATAIGSIVVHASVAIAILWYQVAKAQKSGVGGST